jgi:hypothetical protein
MQGSSTVPSAIFAFFIAQGLSIQVSHGMAGAD